jgi:hypothetical protein
LLLREFRPSWRFQARRHGPARSKGFARAEVQLMARHLEADLAARVL